jgi:prepilin-type N-terminal cleavage/methylation domain-containing protein
MRHNIELKTGFTLMELLVVIAIIAILSSLLLAAVSSSIGKARRIRFIREVPVWGVGGRFQG